MEIDRQTDRQIDRQIDRYIHILKGWAKHCQTAIHSQHTILEMFVKFDNMRMIKP